MSRDCGRGFQHASAGIRGRAFRASAAAIDNEFKCGCPRAHGGLVAAVGVAAAARAAAV
jgi:hypothetical protein